MHTPGRVNPFVNRQPLKSVDRAGFLARVRKSLGHEGGQALPWKVEPPVRDEALIRQVAKDDPGRVDRWVEKAAEQARGLPPKPPAARDRKRR